MLRLFLMCNVTHPYGSFTFQLIFGPPHLSKLTAYFASYNFKAQLNTSTITLLLYYPGLLKTKFGHFLQHLL